MVRDFVSRSYLIYSIYCRFFRFTQALFEGWAIHFAFAFPLIVFAQDGLVFLELAFQFAEGLFAAAEGIFGGAGGVQRAGGQREIYGKRVFFFAGILRERAVQRYQIWFVAFQQTIQFLYMVGYFGCHGLVRVDVLVADRHFHSHTCGRIYDGTRRREVSGTGHERSVAPRNVRGNGTSGPTGIIFPM